jgi:hypothetical protein
MGIMPWRKHMTIFDQVNKLIRDPEAQEEFANLANAAYCKAKNMPVPERFTRESNPTAFSLNQLGLLAAISIASQMSVFQEEGPETREQVYVGALLELGEPGTYETKSGRQFIEAAKHAVWMGCQAGRGDEHLEHKDYVSFELLDEATANLYAIQVQVAARFVAQRLGLVSLENAA